MTDEQKIKQRQDQLLKMNNEQLFQWALQEDVVEQEDWEEFKASRIKGSMFKPGKWDEQKMTGALKGDGLSYTVALSFLTAIADICPPKVSDDQVTVFASPAAKRNTSYGTHNQQGNQYLDPFCSPPGPSLVVNERLRLLCEAVEADCETTDLNLRQHLSVKLPTVMQKSASSETKYLQMIMCKIGAVVKSLLDDGRATCATKYVASWHSLAHFDGSASKSDLNIEFNMFTVCAGETKGLEHSECFGMAQCFQVCADGCLMLMQYGKLNVEDCAVVGVVVAGRSVVIVGVALLPGGLPYCQRLSRHMYVDCGKDLLELWRWCRHIASFCKESAAKCKNHLPTGGSDRVKVSLDPKRVFLKPVREIQGSCGGSNLLNRILELYGALWGTENLRNNEGKEDNEGKGDDEGEAVGNAENGRQYRLGGVKFRVTETGMLVI